MKKFKLLKRVALIVLVVGLTIATCCTMFGCGLFDRSSNKEQEEEPTYDFSIQYDDELTKYSFKTDSEIKVEPRYKEGYVLDGFYTLQDGAGTKMLDWDGSCISTSFSGDGSTVLYPKYTALDYDYVYKVNMRTENSFTAHYNVYGDPQIVGYTISSLENSENFEYMMKAVRSNPNLILGIKASAEFSGAKIEFGVGISKNADKANYAAKQSFGKSSSYTKREIEGTCKAAAITISGSALYVGVLCPGAFESVQVKNVEIEISFVKPDKND